MQCRRYSTAEKAVERIGNVFDNMQAYMNYQITCDQTKATREALTEKEIGNLGVMSCPVYDTHRATRQHLFCHCCDQTLATDCNASFR